MRKDELSQDIIDYLELCCKSKDEEVRKGQAANPNLPEEFLYWLSEDNSNEVLLNLASNPNASSSILEGIIYNLRGDLIDIHNPPEKEEKIDRENKLYTIKAIIENPNITLSSVLDIKREPSFFYKKPEIAQGLKKGEIEKYKSLIEDKAIKKIKEILKTSNVKRDDLRALVNDESEELREAAAKSPRSSQSILEPLSLDDSNKVRQAVAENPRVHSYNLQFLKWDYNKKVRESAIENEAFYKQEDNPYGDPDDLYDDEYEKPSNIDHSYSNLSGFSNPAEKADSLYGIPDPRLLED